jgi:hypothetical protein
VVCLTDDCAKFCWGIVTTVQAKPCLYTNSPTLRRSVLVTPEDIAIPDSGVITLTVPFSRLRGMNMNEERRRIFARASGSDCAYGLRSTPLVVSEPMQAI